MSSANSSNLQMASCTPTVSGKQHTPFCGSNCELSHHDLVTALFTDGRYAISRIERSGDLPVALKQAIDCAKLSGWDQNCFIPDPLEQLRCPLLFLACVFGKFAIVEGLLRNSFSLRVSNQDGETALHFAARHFHKNKTTANFGRKEAFEKTMNILTDYDPKILAVKDKNGRTALHTSASNIFELRGKRQHKKIGFHQFCLKYLFKRLVELEDASVFTRHEVMDVIKATEDNNGDSVLHILARISAFFEVLKFAQDLLFGGMLPEDKNGQGKTILEIARETDPRGAVKVFFLSPSNINGEQGQESSADSTQCEENLSSIDGDMSTHVADIDTKSDQTSHFRNTEECKVTESQNQLHTFVALPEFDPEDDQLSAFSDSDSNVPYIDQVFSLSSEESIVHDEKCGCGKNVEDAITSLKNKVFLLSHEECGVSGKNSDSNKKLEDVITSSKVEVKEPCVEVSPNSLSEHSDKVSDADSSFLEFVVTEGLGLDVQAKKNIVGVVMTQYSDKLNQVEGRLPKLGQLLMEEETALSQKKKKAGVLEEELDLLKKDILAKERCLQKLRQENKVLCEEQNTLKRKVSHCEEMQQQLEMDNLKRVRSD